jgi:D-alanyl-D-alanine carboxypeptidase/D-alanyl-D-alanine-endopeptidase (penicillin-binding protein 4)
MHDESPRSRRDRRSDDPTESAFDELGLSALLGDPTQENPVVAEPEASPWSQETPPAPRSVAPEQPTTPAVESAGSGLRPRRRARADADGQSEAAAGRHGAGEDIEPETAAHPVTPAFSDARDDSAGLTTPIVSTSPIESAIDRTSPIHSTIDGMSPAAPAPEPRHTLPMPPAAEPAGAAGQRDAVLRPRDEAATPTRAFTLPPVGPAAPAAGEATRLPVRARDLPPVDDTSAVTSDDPTEALAGGVAGESGAAGAAWFAGPAAGGTDAAPGTAIAADGVRAEDSAGVAGASTLGALWARVAGSVRRRGDSSGRTGAGGGSGTGGAGGGGRGSGGSGAGGSAGSGGHGGGPFDGILAWIRRNPRTSLIAGVAAGVVVLSGLSFGIGAASAPAASARGASAPVTATATPTPKPTVRPTPATAPAPSKIRTCSVASYAADSGFGTLEAQVMNASTGEVLFDRNGGNPAPTASVLKMLTAAAAYSILGPDYRVPTTVVKGSQPGQVVVIGGGDVTLTRLPTGENSFYTGAPHVDDLANQVKQAWASDPANAGQPITSLVVDTSLYSGPVWQPSWDEHEERVVEGSTPYMTSFMVDGDRNDPTDVESPRSTDPVGRAANVLADDLGGNVTISSGTAPAGAKQLGQVLSQPVSALAEQALTYSDNTIMEELARLVAIKTGAGNSFSAINAGTLKGLEAYGISENGLYFADGSGLSADNKVPASYLTQFMVKVLNRQGALGSIYDGLPIAGKTGTLGPGYGRFDGSFSSNAVGHVNAKTGWIDTARTLAGVIHAKDGTNLTFAIYALNYGGDDAALAAIDNLTTAFYECGNNLSNN